VFDETVYPFSKLNPNAGTHLRSKILLLPTQTQPSGVQIIDDSMDNVHALSVPTNPSDLSGATTKNSIVFDAGIARGTMAQGASIIDMGHEADILAHSSLTAGSDPSSDPPTSSVPP
jgi:hypothetical protein